MNDIFNPGVMCARCGQQQRGSASIDGQPYCHPDDPELPDCYTLWSQTLTRARRLGIRYLIDID